MDRRGNIVLVLPTVLALTGCVSQSRLTGQQSRVIESADADVVLTAASAILQREFGRVTIDREAHTIVSQPVEFRTTRDSGTVRDLYHGRSTMRRIAQFSLGRRGSSTIARLCIDIERQDTARTLSAQPPTGASAIRPRRHRSNATPPQRSGRIRSGRAYGGTANWNASCWRNCASGSPPRRRPRRASRRHLRRIRPAARRTRPQSAFAHVKEGR